MPDRNSNHETRLIDRRCRCGTPLAVPDDRCQWHPSGSAYYASDLLDELNRRQRAELHARPGLMSRIRAGIETTAVRLGLPR